MPLGPLQPPLELTSDAEHDFRLLLRFVTKREGFHFGLAVTDDERVRNRLVERLGKEAAALGVDVLTVDLRALPEDVILLKAVMAALADAPAAEGRRRAVSVVGLERHLDYKHGGSRPEPTDLLGTANFQRDAFPERCPVPLVLWASVLAQPAIARIAPDLWHWRAGSFDFCVGREETWTDRLNRAVPRPEQDWQYLPKEDLERRRALLEELLAADQPPTDTADGPTLERRIRLLLELSYTLFRGGNIPEAHKASLEALALANQRGDDRLRAVSWDRIANVLGLTGELDEALRIRRDEELPVYERLDDIRSKALTLNKIADILLTRGQTDEALRINQNEALPVYERLGDEQAKAFTLSRIADILQARDQLDEALHIRQDELLPVFERLGDVRSKAVTLGKIASILQDRGQLDEALRIRQDEELPVYERLGDVRAKAIALGRIADILQDRGQLDEALRIRRDEELPVYQRMNDREDLAICQIEIARNLLAIDPTRHRNEATRLLRRALREAEGMGLADAPAIRNFMVQIGIPAE